MYTGERKVPTITTTRVRTYGKDNDRNRKPLPGVGRGSCQNWQNGQRSRNRGSRRMACGTASWTRQNALRSKRRERRRPSREASSSRSSSASCCSRRIDPRCHISWKCRRRLSAQSRRVPRNDARRIRNALRSLADDPRPIGSLKLRGFDNVWRIRARDYRVIYEIHDDEQRLMVLKIVRRNERTYRRL